MKAVILAGGLGTRMREETEFKPKPMVEVGGRPVLLHLMRIFASQGVTEFIVLVGYKGEIIKRYFRDFAVLSSDFTVQLGADSKLELHGEPQEANWKITIVDTGPLTLTAERVLRARDFIGEEDFFLTYGDGLANVNLSKLIQLHHQTRATLTISSSRPRSRFGVVTTGPDGLVASFDEKPEGKEVVNIGFMVAKSELFDFLRPGESLEQQPLKRLTEARKLAAYLHEGFWQPMDTVTELEALNSLWDRGLAPWASL